MLSLPDSGQSASIASARIDLNVLSGRILVVAVALREIVTGTRRGLRARNGPNGAARDGADGGANRSSGDQAAENAGSGGGGGGG
jgi:hypothetical protein